MTGANFGTGREIYKPYKFIGFGDIYGPKPYKFIGSDGTAEAPDTLPVTGSDGTAEGAGGYVRFRGTRYLAHLHKVWGPHAL